MSRSHFSSDQNSIHCGNDRHSAQPTFPHTHTHRPNQQTKNYNCSHCNLIGLRFIFRCAVSFSTAYMNLVIMARLLPIKRAHKPVQATILMYRSQPKPHTYSALRTHIYFHIFQFSSVHSTEQVNQTKCVRGCLIEIYMKALAPSMSEPHSLLAEMA